MASLTMVVTRCGRRYVRSSKAKSTAMRVTPTMLTMAPLTVLLVRCAAV